MNLNDPVSAVMENLVDLILRFVPDDHAYDVVVQVRALGHEPGSLGNQFAGSFNQLMMLEFTQNENIFVVHLPAP
ncbi:hypothetical protein SDC9_204776 [bioreactor metagenome]|uniref:Uncharacterized protein n=1 Tax=bioreactor metagenome TaxID=1076179 RepID=A0A645J1U5_9ZZZZ